MSSPFLLVLVSCVFIRPFFRSLAATQKKKELTSSVYEITHSVIFLFIIQLPLEKTCACVRARARFALLAHSLKILFIVQLPLGSSG